MANATPAWRDELAPEQRERLRGEDRSRPPRPMLAQLAQPSEIPTGWGFQRKWDGMRVLAELGSGTELWARSGRNVTSSFPELADRLTAIDREAIVDGEIVVLRDGRERFALLQRRMNVEHPSPSLVAEIPVRWAVFDLLALDGYDVRGLSQHVREALLHELAPALGEVILAETVAHGRPAHQVREAACRLGWEGLIAKDPQARYQAGRQRAWRKIKCLQHDRFVVVGYRDLEPGGVGSLVLAREPIEGELAPAGSVGTGLSDEERARLHDRLQPLRRGDPPLPVDDVRGQVHWVEPALAIEVAYSETTPEGNLRHPRLAGLEALGAREASP